MSSLRDAAKKIVPRRLPVDARAEEPDGRTRVRVLAVALVVGLALADSSIVVLAVPDLLVELDAPLTDVAHVVTAYNLALALGAVVAVPLSRTGRAVLLTQAGVVLFTVAGVACAVAPGLSVLVAARAAQGAGAALLLAGSLPVLVGLVGRAGRRAWTVAGTAGAAVGPALGGALTQAHDWRAVFIVQAPIGVAASLALLRSPRSGHAGTRGEPRPGLQQAAGAGGKVRLGAAHVALMLVSGGLVGALFLVVVLLVNGWGLKPLAAAAVVSAVPVAAAVAGRASRWMAPAPAVSAGALLLATGLAGLALLPTSSLLLVTGWLAACGAGLGLAVSPLVEATVHGQTAEQLGRAGSWSVASRHLGLTLALLVVPVVLAVDLADSIDKATTSGTSQVLDVQVPLVTKISLASALADAIAATPDGELPDLRPTFTDAARQDPQHAEELTRLRADLEETVRAGAIRGFRNALLITAALAAAAVFPALLLFGNASQNLRTARRSGRASTTAAAGAAGVSALLLAGQVLIGGTSYGPPPTPDPCTDSTRYPDQDLDGRLQRVLLRALSTAACELDTDRQLVLTALAPDPPDRPLPFTDDQLDQAIRTGLLSALNAEQEEGLNGLVATVLREIARRVDVRDLLEQFTDP